MYNNTFKHRSSFLILLASFAVMAAVVPTTLDDFFMPGSQPGESGNLESPLKCDNCHGGYDIAVEPSFNWRGSMMSQSARDPVYEACLTIANQDVPFGGDICIRCHSPEGWLGDRSTPTDGSALTTADREGVHCDFCHRLVQPTSPGVNPFPDDLFYTENTYSSDQQYLRSITEIPPMPGNGMYVVDSDNSKRGPFEDAGAKHQLLYSPFHKESALCGTCHDVSNPVYSRNLDGTYTANAFGLPSPSFNMYDMFPVERTYSEWLMSAYNTEAGIYAPEFGGNKSFVSTCQDCHMRDISGVAANKTSAIFRDDLPHHDMTGGNTFVPEIIKTLYPGQVDATALDSGANRARSMLQTAASLEVDVQDAGSTYIVNVRITNKTGHKLPSGYPEGRRIWIYLLAMDPDGNTMFESGHYDFNTGTLTQDPNVKIYEIKPGLDADVASLAGLDAGPSFHFALNNKIYFDNRIPPRGFTNANFELIQSQPVGYGYADGQYWDDTQYTVPLHTTTIEVKLYYQTLSKEYVEFLRDDNVTNDAGQVLYDLWNTHGKSAPVTMNTMVINTSRDSDGDGIPDHSDNCPEAANPDQTDTDQDGLGAACDCDDNDQNITTGSIFYLDSDGDSYGNPNDSVLSCSQPDGYVINNDDCNDSNSNITTAAIWYADTDGDNFGDPAQTVSACEQPSGYVANNLDCDDSDGNTYPGASPVADGKDNDCDGTIDRVAQVISFETIPDQDETTSGINLTATASSGLPVYFTIEKGNVELVGTTLVVHGPGEVQITAHQDGNDGYEAASPVIQLFCIIPAKPVIIQTSQNDQVLLTSSSDTGNYWYLNGEILTGKNDSTLIPVESGSYTLQVIVDQCASAFSDPVVVNITSTVIPDHGTFRLYPNPTDGWIYIHVPPGLESEKLKINVTDIFGRCIIRSIPIDPIGSSIILFLGNYPSGFYYYFIEDTIKGIIFQGQFILQ